MLGSQTPRVEHVPEGFDHPDADAVLELNEAAGLVLDDWQKAGLRKSLRRRDDKWAAFEVGWSVPRQNGKNEILIAREVGGLFVLNEGLLIHTAHLADTAKEAFRRLEQLIEANDWLSREVKHIWRTNGHEAIELFGPKGRRVTGGSRIRFRTRTKGGGRGFSGDFVAFDEAMFFPETSHASILPIVSARPDPQIWYTGSAVDKVVHEDGRVFSRARARGHTGDDPSLAWFEWSLTDELGPSEIDEQTAADPASWQIANPALGIRISTDYIEKEFRSFDTRSFSVERLGVGDWFDPNADETVFDLEKWRACQGKPGMQDPVCFAIDASPSRAWASIVAAGAQRDGVHLVEVVDRKRGTGWIVQRAAELKETHKPLGFVVASDSPAASLIHQLEEAGVTVTEVSAKDHAQACGMFYDAVDQANTRHLAQAELNAAVRGAAQRPLGDAWAWSRKNSSTDISPLVGATLAYWGSVTTLGTHRKGPPRVIDLSAL